MGLAPVLSGEFLPFTENRRRVLLQTAADLDGAVVAQITAYFSHDEGDSICGKRKAAAFVKAADGLQQTD